MVLQLFPLQLERICDKTCLGGPRLWTQMHFHWNLESLEFNYSEKEENSDVHPYFPHYSTMNNMLFSTKVLEQKTARTCIAGDKDRSKKYASEDN